MDPWVVGVDPGGTKIEVDLVDSVEPDRGPRHTHQPRSRAAHCRRHASQHTWRSRRVCCPQASR